ncbi:hypothetical protein OIU84_006849 [Salix udensis]|uniref:Uncharacterized protein n=1 Tax=Salix udensis TaxID=889485 RepID=A0AAD6JZ98_9ROSI|nr:hypothetical protein OIU84_006849 [Salix udensis]
MDFQKRRVQLLVFIVGIVALSITAEKCRQLVGDDYSSQSGKFTIFNCFDMSSGTLACAVKEGVKLYFYNIRSSHVERARNLAIEHSLLDTIGQGMSAQDAAKTAQKEGGKGSKAGKAANKTHHRSCYFFWMGFFFEALYYGGTVTEGFLRGSGTLVGAYTGGFLGEERLGRVGYLVGSHLGSWVGGRIGLMVYDVVDGVHYLLQFAQGEDGEVHETSTYANFEVSEDSQGYTSYEASEDSNVYESPPEESSESYEHSEFR